MISFIVSILGSTILNAIGEKMLSPYLTSRIDVHLSYEGVFIAVVILILIFFLLVRPILAGALNQRASALFSRGSFNSKINIGSLSF